MQGTTATCLYISADKKLYLAHVGDTRAVLCTRSSNPPKQATSLASELEASYKEAGVVQITKDHTLQDVQERQAVVGRGATIANERVNGTLQITRALGDSNLSNYISCIPDIFEHTLTPDDEFLIIACDGIWDVLTPVQAVEHVKSAVKQGAPKDVAQSLVTCAFDKNSGDNLSAIVVFFQPQELSK